MKRKLLNTILLLLMIQMALFNNPSIVKAEPLKNTNSYAANSSETGVNDSVTDMFKQPTTNTDTTGSTNNDNSSVVNNDETNVVGISVWDVIKAIIAFIFVVGLLLFILKFISKRTRTYNSTQLLDNLGGIPLGNHKSIQIVKVGSRILIVGVGENIQLLKEINDTNEYNEIIEGFNSKMDQLASPSDIVTKVMNLTKGKNEVSSTKKEPNTSFQQMLNNQLMDLKDNRKKMLEDINEKGTDK